MSARSVQRGAVGEDERDRGSILVIALVVIVITSLIALSLARFVTTASQASASRERALTAHRAASAAASYAIEELGAKRLAPCTVQGPLSIPSAALPAGTVTAACVPLSPQDGHPVVALDVRATVDGTAAKVRAVVQVFAGYYGTSVLEWQVT